MSFPGTIGSGESLLVSDRSAEVEVETMVSSVSELSPGFGSVVEEVTVAVLEIGFEPLYPPGTLMTRVKVSVSPLGSEAMVQPGGGVLPHVQSEAPVA